MNQGLRFDFGRRDQLFKELEQFVRGFDRSSVGLRKVTKGSSGRDLESVESVHDRQKLADNRFFSCVLA